MKTESKAFHLGDVLSITTRRLVSPRLMAGVYDILNYMTGESLFTHALPLAGKVCAPVLLKQHPDLAAIDAELVDGTNWEAWLAEQVARYGEMRDVQPLATGDYEAKNPLQELADMGVPPERMVLIETDGRTT